MSDRPHMLYEFPINPKPFIMDMVEELDREFAMSDLSDCPYFLRTQGVEGYENGTCGYGCREEPACITSQPSGGWPSMDPEYDERAAWAEQFTDWLLENAVVHVDLGVGR